MTERSNLITINSFTPEKTKSRITQREKVQRWAILL